MSFTAALTALKGVLETDTALTAFVAANFPRALSVRLAYRNREELNVGDLPAVIITRPRVTKQFRTGVRDGDHTVMLYLVFHQDDNDKGPLQLIQFEELIDDAITANNTLSGTAINATPGESVNDEGKNHPTYCIVSELTIQHRRFTA